MAVSGSAADRRGLLRGAVLAAACAVLTAAGHLAGGGSLPDLAVLVVLLPLLAGGFAALAERSRGTLGTLGVLGLGQLVLHQLIELLSPAHAAHQALDAVAPSGPGMLITHAVATLVSAVALRFADRAIALLGGVLRRVLPHRPPALRADRPLATLALPGPAVSLRLARALAAAEARRGPPVGC